MCFHTAKCKALRLGTENAVPAYRTGDCILESCDPEKDLGVVTALVKLPLLDTYQVLHLDPAHWTPGFLSFLSLNRVQALILAVGVCLMPPYES